MTILSESHLHWHLSSLSLGEVPSQALLCEGTARHCQCNMMLSSEFKFWYVTQSLPSRRMAEPRSPGTVAEPGSPASKSITLDAAVVNQ
jgi:hypothetical protein